MNLKKVAIIGGKSIVGVVFLALFAVVSLNLFFPDVWKALEGSFQSSMKTEDNSANVTSLDEVVIAYPHQVGALEPVVFNAQDRSGIVNIYESLVQVDRNLQIRPGLAVSWGRVDDVTWEFRLRPGVKFHNGDGLDVNDVLTSIDRARNYFESDLKPMLANISNVRRISADRIHVITKKPDPLLLNKIAAVLIFPSDFKDFGGTAIGTGPYKLVSFSLDDGGGMVLERFEDYWGAESYFQKATLKFIVDHEERVAALKEGKVDLVVNVPPAAIPGLTNSGVEILAQPNLQVNFLLFNFKNSFLSNKEVREVMRMIFDKNKFLELTAGYAKPVNQFVSNGIFGYNPDIEDSQYNPEEAKKKIREVSRFQRPIVKFHLVDGLQKFGDYIEEQIEQVGIGVDAYYFDAAELSESVKRGDADIYFFGWRSELGDVSDFMQAVAHSRKPQSNYGLYNGLNYRNEEVDRLIEQSEVNLVVEERREQLHKIMSILINDDVLGVPLYESEIIYGFSSQINFVPRIDGYLFVNELSAKAL